MTGAVLYAKDLPRLSAHIAEYAANGYVFPNRDGEPLTVNGWRHIFQRAAVKILFPTLLCIFPAIFIVILGPAAFQIANMVTRLPCSTRSERVAYLHQPCMACQDFSAELFCNAK